MRKSERHRRAATAFRLLVAGFQNARQEKRLFRQSPVEIAELEGESDGTFRPSRRNPYPPGLRHDAYNRGRVATSRSDYYGDI